MIWREQRREKAEEGEKGEDEKKGEIARSVDVRVASGQGVPLFTCEALMTPSAEIKFWSDLGLTFQKIRMRLC